MSEPLPAVTAAQMREADRRCIEDIGIPGAVLMDHAGKSVYARLSGQRIGVVCGKGNNGGDGFVTARYALLARREVRVVLLAEAREIVGDARLYLEMFQRLGGVVETARTVEEAQAAVASLSNCNVLVDAVLGTGLGGEVRGLARAAIESWPACYTVSVDIPSGLDADTGLPLGAAVRANETVTFQRMKAGFLNPESRCYTGAIAVADIGIPDCCFV